MGKRYLIEEVDEPESGGGCLKWIFYGIVGLIAALVGC